MRSDELTFSHLSELILALGKVPPRRSHSRRPPRATARASRLVEAWIDRAKLRLDQFEVEKVLTNFFRLFFPEVGARRRYGLQETTLAPLLENVLFGDPRGRFSGWDTGRGCLGAEVRAVLGATKAGGGWPRVPGGLSLRRADSLLDELASQCAFSAPSLRASPSARSKSSILSDLVSALSPPEMSVMVQIILRDLSPLLYPAPSPSADISLLTHNSAMYHVLELDECMRYWCSGMSALYRATADLDVVCATLERAMSRREALQEPSPSVGVPVAVPKSVRPGTCSVATKHLRGEVACETKYDGERLQVHVDLSLPHDEQIRIFSKSQRDSTHDRHLLLPVIRASLGLPLCSAATPLLLSRAGKRRSARLPRRMILEGEMVPYNESTARIDPFWRLAAAKGHYEARDREEETQHESVSTGHTASPRKGREREELHLMVVWFDVLLLESDSLLKTSYGERRAKLEAVVLPIEGFSKLAETTTIDFSLPTAQVLLREHFARVIAEREEGLMLKPLSSSYNSSQIGQKWVKLKKDFVPGAGDTLDFELVGARWEKERGRKLGVPPSALTTFFVGLRADHLGTRRGKKHFHVLFAASYGLDRRQLSLINHQIRSNDPQSFDPSSALGTTFRAHDPREGGRYTIYDSPLCSFTFSLAAHLSSPLTAPTLVFPAPRTCELTGAGFQKSAGSPWYELRWPRMTKASREDGEPVDLRRLQEIAERAMFCGKRTPEEERERRRSIVWDGVDLSPEGPGKLRREALRATRERDKWLRVLERSEKLPAAECAPACSLEAEDLVDASAATRLHDVLNRTPSSTHPPAQECAPTAVRLLDPISLLGEAFPSSSGESTETTASPRSQQQEVNLPRSPERKRLFPPLLDSPDQLTTSSTLFRAVQSLSKVLCKKPRLSEPAPAARASSSPGLARAGSRRHRARLSLPAYSLSASCVPLSTTPRANSASQGFFWSVLGTDALGAVPEPRHSSLDSTNFLRDPLSVLWAAGIPIAGRPPFAGPRRRGFVFVEDRAEAEKLKQDVGAKARGSEAVWVVERGACERKGEFDMHESLLWVF